MDCSVMVESWGEVTLVTGTVVTLWRLVSWLAAGLSDLVETLLKMDLLGWMSRLVRLVMPRHSVTGDVNVKLFKAELTMAAKISLLGVLGSS